jgi:GT2 family glycosyltransferase
MKARFKGQGSKSITVEREVISFPSGKWISVPTLSFYKKLKEVPSLFDVVCEYDIKPFLPHARHLRFSGKVIETGHAPTIAAMNKVRSLKVQARNVDKGTTIFRVKDYTDAFLRGYGSVLDTVKVLCGRSKGGIGDILMTLPTVEAIAKKYENYVIDFTCPEQYLSLVENNPFINNAIPFDEVSQLDYEIVYDMTRACITYEGRTQPDVDFNRTEIFARIGQLSLENLPRPKVYFSPVEILTASRIDFKRSAKSGGILTDIYSTSDGYQLPNLTIGVCYNSSAKVRTYKHGNVLMKRLTDEYPNADILFFQEQENHDFSKYPNVHTFTNFSLREVALLISKCDLFFGPDTGLTHIAASLRIPTVWFFTHIDGKVRTKGYDTSVVVQCLDNCPAGRPCWYDFPCDETGSREHMDECPCVMDATSLVVLDAIKRELATPNVSIITTAHNRSDLSKECVRRLLMVKKYNDELRFVDSGSTDDTEEYFGSLYGQIPNYFFARNDENLGVTTPRNQALLGARGRFVWILDNDQFIEPHSLHNIMQTEGDIVGVEGWYIGSDGLATRHEKCGMLNYVGAGGMFMLRQIMQSLNWFDEIYSPAWFEDADICLKAAQEGYSVAVCKDADIEHLAHQTTHSQNDFSSREVWMRNRKVFVDRWSHLELDRPLCSIVILNHNAAHATLRCLRSIHRTTDFSDVEIIVVDNGSSKDDVEKLTSYQKPNLTYLLQDENLMVSKGRNLGGSKARGEFILFLDNDMALPDNWLQPLVSSCENFEYVATSPKVVDIRPNDDHVRFRSTVIKDGHLVEMYDDEVRECACLPGGATFVYRKVWEQFPFDEYFVYGLEDYDWCMRVRSAGHKLVNTPAVVFNHIKPSKGRTIAPYDKAEKDRKGSSFIEDSVRLFLYRWRKELPDQWRQPGWAALAVGGVDVLERINQEVGVFDIVEKEVETLYPAERIGEVQCGY